MSASLVGSEMCIRDSPPEALRRLSGAPPKSPELLRALALWSSRGALRSSPVLSGALHSSPELPGALWSPPRL
eukprot:7314920-Alexandrium_andersonii.AAC.1